MSAVDVGRGRDKEAGRQLWPEVEVANEVEAGEKVKRAKITSAAAAVGVDVFNRIERAGPNFVSAITQEYEQYHRRTPSRCTKKWTVGR